METWIERLRAQDAGGILSSTEQQRQRRQRNGWSWIRDCSGWPPEPAAEVKAPYIIVVLGGAVATAAGRAAGLP